MGYLQQLVISFAGAIIAASLAFYVRAKLDAHALRTAELRIAYVHYVRFSQFLAAEVAIKGLAKSLAPAAIVEELGKSAQYDVSHEVCAVIAAYIEDEVASQERPPESIFSSSLLVTNFIDGLKSIRLTDEQLSKLPRASVLIHFNFQDLADQLAGVLKKWEFSIANNNFKWATAEAIHDQWKLLVSLSEASREARVAMLSSGVVSEKEGFEILKRQVGYFTSVIGSQLRDGAKLASARQDFKAKRGDAK